MLLLEFEVDTSSLIGLSLNILENICSSSLDLNLGKSLKSANKYFSEISLNDMFLNRLSRADSAVR